jgi:predicted enzyme related to lactoylglutathione lyase
MSSVSREHPFGHGRLAYIQIPALDAHASAAFYKDIFGWQKMVAAGSKVVKQPYLEGDVWVATLIDPAGNVIGIWQFDPR